MYIRNLIPVIASLCAVSFSNGHALPDDVRESAGNQKFIPGVFISSEALKNLQDRAQTNDIISQLGNENLGNSDPMVINPVPQDATIKVNPPSVDTQRMETANPVLVNQAAAPSHQTVLANQQPILTNQQPILARQPSIVTNQQPLILQQTPLSIQQPSLSNQPMLLNQASLPNQQAVYLTQPALSNQQPLLITQQPGQTILLNQQPSLASQQPTVVSQLPTVISQQPAIISQQPNMGQQLVLQNGQIAQIAYQQPTTVQNPATLYAVISNVPNQGVSNTNSYLVPIQQLQQAPNAVSINGK